MCVCLCARARLCMCLRLLVRMHRVLTEARRGHHIPEASYMWLLAVLWVQGTELQFSLQRVAGALNCWFISSDPILLKFLLM